LDSRFWIAGDEMIERRLGRTGRDWLEGDFSGVVVEANLKVVEHSRATEKIKADAEALRETDRSSNFGGADLERKVMNESWNIASVANDDHLLLAASPVDADAHSLVNGQHTERRSGIDKNPELMAIDRDGNDGHQIAPMTRLRKF